jgi:undecaprenyl-diphosphatase
MKLLNSLYKIDLHMLLWCTNSRRHRVIPGLAKKVSKTGDGYLQLLLPLCMLLLDDQQGQVFFFTMMFGFSIQLPIYWLLKNSLKRQRPPEVIPSFHSLITASDKFSFPSGHSSAAFLLANITALFYGLYAWPLYLWATAVAMSRVLLGVHFPTDILAGIGLGTAIALYIVPLSFIF